MRADLGGRDCDLGGFLENLAEGGHRFHNEAALLGPVSHVGMRLEADRLPQFLRGEQLPLRPDLTPNRVCHG